MTHSFFEPLRALSLIGFSVFPTSQLKSITKDGKQITLEVLTVVQWHYIRTITVLTKLLGNYNLSLLDFVFRPEKKRIGP